jgi:hypothetical protein
MTFWLFSGSFQKPGWLMVVSRSSICDFRAGASKIAPHGESLLAERLVSAFEFFESHG